MSGQSGPAWEKQIPPPVWSHPEDNLPRAIWPMADGGWMCVRAGRNQTWSQPSTQTTKQAMSAADLRMSGDDMLQTKNLTPFGWVCSPLSLPPMVGSSQ